MYNATSDQALTRIQPVVKDLIRMDIFKSMLLGQAIRMEREEKEAETMSKNTEKKDATKHDNED